MEKDKFNKIWSKLFYKKKAIFVGNGKTAIYEALKILKSK